MEREPDRIGRGRSFSACLSDPRQSHSARRDSAADAMAAPSVGGGGAPILLGSDMVAQGGPNARSERPGAPEIRLQVDDFVEVERGRRQPAGSMHGLGAREQRENQLVFACSFVAEVSRTNCDAAVKSSIAPAKFPRAALISPRSMNCPQPRSAVMARLISVSAFSNSRNVQYPWAR